MELWAAERNLGVFIIQMEFKVTRLHEITKGVSIDKRNKG